MTEELVYDDISLKEIPVSIGGEKHVLCEADGAVAEKYKNAILNGVTLSDGKATSLKNMASVESLLVSLCLYRIDGETRIRVGVERIQTWPSRIKKDLFDKIKQISELDEEEETEESLVKQIADLQAKLEKVKESSAKNEQTGITDGTD